MITQNYINFKILQGQMAIMAMTDKMCDQAMLGYDDRDYMIRLMDLIPRVKAIEYITPEKIDTNELLVGVNEIFDLLEDLSGEMSFSSSYIPSNTYNFDPTVNSSVLTSLQELSITPTQDAQLIFTGLPFRVSEVKIESLSLYVGGEFQAYGESKDYHIQGTSLIWHSDFDINIGDVVILKYMEL